MKEDPAVWKLPDICRRYAAGYAQREACRKNGKKSDTGIKIGKK